MASVVTIFKRDALIRRKISALQAKNVQAIVASQARISGLADGYDAPALQAWIDRRINALTQLRDATAQQIQTALTNYYNSLTAPQQAVADQILAGDYSSLPNLNATQFEIAVIVILYRTMAVDDGSGT